MTTPRALPLSLPADVARSLLALALALGIAGDLVLRHGMGALGSVVWVLLAVTTAIAMAARAGRTVPTEARAWFVVAVLAAIGAAWRDSDALEFADFCVTIGSLCMAAISINAPACALFARRLRDTIVAWLRGLLAGMPGPLPLLYASRGSAHDGPAGTGMGDRARTGLRLAAIVAALGLVFGALLVSDPLFASFVRLPDIDLETVLQHGLLIVLFTWFAAGWARAALVADLDARERLDRLPFTLDAKDVTAALGTLIVLFALYVASQLGWMFGGEAFLRARTGLTAAAYARRGFFQMIWVALLVLPVLLATRAMLRPDPALERRHTLFALPLLALLGLMIASAVARFQIYVRYFGLTSDRFYALVFMGWLAIVLAWLALTALRGRGARFAAGAAISGLAILAGLHVASPERLIARYDIARVERAAAGDSTRLDLRHLASLGGEAADLAVQAVLTTPLERVGPRLASDDSPSTQRCNAAWSLLQRWGPAPWRARHEEEAGWRGWNAGARHAAQVVGANGVALRTVQHGCVGRKRR